MSAGHKFEPIRNGSVASSVEVSVFPSNRMFLRNERIIALLLWAIPSFAASLPGIKNFDQVDTRVYRGAQPTPEGIRQLANLGVKTVVDLRETGERSKKEQRIVTGNGMRYINVPMSGLTPPTSEEITKILNLLEDLSSGPVFVHCLRGADRTGAVIAAYRIDYEKWDNGRALKDAKAHGMSPFQLPRENFIRNFHARNAAAATPVVAAAAILNN